MKCQKVDGGLAVHLLAPTVDNKYILDEMRITISDFTRDYWWNRLVIDYDESLPADVTASIVEDIDGIFVQAML